MGRLRRRPHRRTGVGPVQIGREADLNSGDTAWMLTSSALVLLMTGPGLALFYGGLVQRKNVLSTMMHSFILMALVSVVWAIVGYSLAFDAGTPWIRRAALRLARRRSCPKRLCADHPAHHLDGLPNDVCADYPRSHLRRLRRTHEIQQHAGLFRTLAAGGLSPMAHMVWGKGGLFNAWMGGAIGAMDFAGGTVVHISSSVSALISLDARQTHRLRQNPHAAA